MPYINLSDIRMYYDDLGSGPPLILLNGAFNTNSSNWMPLRPLLAEEYRVLHIEHRGHGRTTNPAGYITYELLAKDVIEFISRLGLGPTHVAGISEGAITALTVGMQRPDIDETIIAVGANYCFDDQVHEANALLELENIEQNLPNLAEQLADRHDHHHEPGYWRTLVDQITENLKIAPAYSEADLQRITAPTLLITGETDRWCNLNQILAMRKAIPNAEMLIVNHAGMTWVQNHLIQDTRPEIVGPAISEFLARCSEN